MVDDLVLEADTAVGGGCGGEGGAVEEVEGVVEGGRARRRLGDVDSGWINCDDGADITEAVVGHDNVADLAPLHDRVTDCPGPLARRIGDGDSGGLRVEGSGVLRGSCLDPLAHHGRRGDGRGDGDRGGGGVTGSRVVDRDGRDLAVGDHRRRCRACSPTAGQGD